MQGWGTMLPGQHLIVLQRAQLRCHPQLRDQAVYLSPLLVRGGKLKAGKPDVTDRTKWRPDRMKANP